MVVAVAAVVVLRKKGYERKPAADAEDDNQFFY
jgi:hypothetical protein